MFIEGDELAGSAQATYAMHPPKPRAYINSVVVDEQYRGMKLGVLLMNELQTRIKVRWPRTLSTQLTSNPKRNTQRFYTDLGYQMRTKENGNETIVYTRDF